MVDITDVEKLLNQALIDEIERQQLLDTVHKTIHIEVVHYILNELPEKHKISFLTQLEAKPHDEGISIFLKRTIDDLDTKLRNVITAVKQDFIDVVEDYLKSTKEWYAGS